VTDIPPSAKWVSQFVESVNRALLGDLHAWDLLGDADPLKRTVLLRKKQDWRREEVPLVRSLLKEWAEKNDCVYKRSQWKKKDFCALILLKGLGPLRDESPFD
jgi:hypothetical protein